MPAKSSFHHHSLYLTILRWTLIILLILVVVSGVFSFWSSYHESNSFQQENLKNIAKLISKNPNLTKNLTKNLNKESLSFEQSFTHSHYQTSDDEGGLNIDIWISSNETSPTFNRQPNEQQAWQTLQAIPKGLSSQNIDGEPWQVYRLDEQDKTTMLQKTVIVRQNSDLQKELSQNSAILSSVPLVFAMIIFLAIVSWVMWRAFRPVKALSQTISQRPTHDLSPLSTDELPKEILPFAHAINELLVKVKDNVDAQQRFIADASHELRSPLTATSLQLQRIQRLVSDEKVQTELDKLALRIKRNQDLVEQLLTLARLNAKQPDGTATALVPLIEQSVNLLLPIIDNKDIALNLMIDPTCQALRLSADATAMLLLVKNLLQNAVLYTPKGGTVSIIMGDMTHCAEFIQAQSVCVIGQSNQKLNQFARHQVMVQIMDTGKGIDPKNYQKIFEPFMRLSDNHSNAEPVTGTGLGLAMVKTICEQTGIQLFLSPAIAQSIKKSEDMGLCVTLILPNELIVFQG